MQRNRLKERLNVVVAVSALADHPKRPVDLRVRGNLHRGGSYTFASSLALRERGEGLRAHHKEARNRRNREDGTRPRSLARVNDL